MAYEWNKTAFVEFETMLRRRLRSGAAPVAACAGFDLDAASAYLEDALGGSHRAGYESHLAGCAICRRHLIELARLAQTTPQTEAQPVAITDRTPAWLRWRAVVAGWFDLSAWNLKWQITGATGAAFAILIAVLGVQSWRQPSNQAARVIAPSATPPALAESGVEPLQSPTPEPSPQDLASSVAVESFAIPREPSQIPAPAPLFGPKVDAPKLDVTASGKALAPIVNQPSEAPFVAKPGGAEAAQNPPSQPSASVDMESSAKVGQSVFREGSKEQVAIEPVQSPRITPPHGYNPMNPAPPELELRHRTLARVEDRTPGPGKSQPRLNPESLPEKIKRYLFPSSKLGFNSESERRAKPDKQETPEDKSPKPMLIPIRDKVFRFEKGMLIDRDYKPEMQEWRVWTLKRGSDLYKRVLADDPLLKEFFDRGPILIVWKNRIYQVLK